MPVFDLYQSPFLVFNNARRATFLAFRALSIFFEYNIIVKGVIGRKATGDPAAPKEIVRSLRLRISTRKFPAATWYIFSCRAMSCTVCLYQKLSDSPIQYHPGKLIQNPKEPIQKS